MRASDCGRVTDHADVRLVLKLWASTMEALERELAGMADAHAVLLDKLRASLARVAAERPDA